MKKFLSLTLALLLSLACITGCGKTKEPPKSDFSFNKNHNIVYSGSEEVINIPTEIEGEAITGLSWILLKNREDESKIKKIIIPETVTSMNLESMWNYTNLIEYEVDENNPEYCSVDGVIYSKDKTQLLYVPTAKTEYTIPKYVTVIGAYAFCFWQGKELYIPSNVEKIGSILSRDLTITLDSSFKNDTELINSLARYDDVERITVICDGEETTGDISKYEEEKFEKLRNKTFSGNRTLWELSSLDRDNDDYKNKTDSYLNIKSISVKIEGKEMVITISADYTLKYSGDWIVSVGYYNAAGELQGTFHCDMGIIEGNDSVESTFRGEPNNINSLYYYRITEIALSTRH